MHIEFVHFDRVFDAPHARGVFSFESGGRRHFGVTLPGRVIPKSGETWVVGFDEPGNWGAILACLDMTADRVYYGSSPARRSLLAEPLMCAAGGLLFLLVLFLLGPAFTFGLIALAVAVFAARGLRRNRQLATVLRRSARAARPG